VVVAARAVGVLGGAGAQQEVVDSMMDAIRTKGIPYLDGLVTPEHIADRCS
jgi:hypothetical protein